jgi:hypothetical protein
VHIVLLPGIGILIISGPFAVRTDGSSTSPRNNLDPDHPVAGLKDSKQLTPARREALYAEITGCLTDT